MIQVDPAFIDELADAIAERVLRRIGGTAAKKLLTVREAADIIGRTEDAVYQLISQGRLGTIRHGRRVHIEREELERFIDRGRQ